MRSSQPSVGTAEVVFEWLFRHFYFLFYFFLENGSCGCESKLWDLIGSRVWNEETVILRMIHTHTALRRISDS